LLSGAVIAGTPDAPAAAAGASAVAAPPPAPVGRWLRAQAINVRRHAEALRPFRRGEFGNGPESPSEGHLQVVNALISRLREGLFGSTDRVEQAVEAAEEDPSTRRLQSMVARKHRAHDWVRGIEKIWDFYFELFGQRQSVYGVWLLGCDRIALDCYQYAYLGVGKAKSVPAPPAFAYMRTGFSPATYRRGIPLSRLGRQLNPFPLIQLPFHRLVNPWTLGAMLHEVSHNLQTDLGLSPAVRHAIQRRLARDGFSPAVASVWARWNRETFADLSGLLLGGPAIVGSLFDILARDPGVVVAYNPRAPHPTPVLRAELSCELLRRMGFQKTARRYRAFWRRMYPDRAAGGIPDEVLRTFPAVLPRIVDTIAYQPYEALGGKSLAEVIRFEHKEQSMIEEAAHRLAAGNDPGVVPERFLISASRVALDRGLAAPEVIKRNFYLELARR